MLKTNKEIEEKFDLTFCSLSEYINRKGFQTTRDEIKSFILSTRKEDIAEIQIMIEEKQRKKLETLVVMYFNGVPVVDLDDVKGKLWNDTPEKMR